MRKAPRCIYYAGAIVMISILIFFGLRPKGMSYKNPVRWLNDQDGIEVQKYGTVYVNELNQLIEHDGKIGFSIELAFQPTKSPTKGFNSLVMLHNGSDETQLIIAQWQSSIIIMNGNDYDNRRRLKRMVVKNVFLPPKKVFIVVSYNKSEGTNLFVDGMLVKKDKLMELKIPSGDSNLQMVLGNSVTGKHGWVGNIFGLTLYNQVLPKKTIMEHFKTWQTDMRFPTSMALNPLLIYLFNEREGSKIVNHAGKNHHLAIPHRPIVLQKNFLSSPFDNIGYSASTVLDIIWNFIGFIPMGILVTAAVSDFNNSKKIAPIVLAIATCSFLSLLIEIFQAWIPSRHSSILDLALNTIGGMVGAIFWLAINKKIGLFFSGVKPA